MHSGATVQDFGLEKILIIQLSGFNILQRPLFTSVKLAKSPPNHLFRTYFLCKKVTVEICSFTQILWVWSEFCVSSWCSFLCGCSFQAAQYMWHCAM